MQTLQEDRAQYIQDFAESCEQFGMSRLSGGIVAALLVGEEPGPCARRLAEILQADENEVERELEPLIRGGLVEQDATVLNESFSSPGFRVNPEAWSVLLSRQLVSLMTFRRLAERGLSLQESSGGAAQGVLRDMHDLYAYAEVELPAMLERFALERAEEHERSLAAGPREALRRDISQNSSGIQETA